MGKYAHPEYYHYFLCDNVNSPDGSVLKQTMKGTEKDVSLRKVQIILTADGPLGTSLYCWKLVGDVKPRKDHKANGKYHTSSCIA